MESVVVGSGEPAALFERVGNIGVITLNRQRAMNAVNAAVSSVVGEALEEIATDPGIAVGVITGAGRAFCAGMDLKAFAAGESVTAPGHEEWGFAGFTRHYIDKPVIAAINGVALGGGAEIVLACDLAVMSADAVIGFPEVARGLFAAGGGVIRLPRIIPRRFALEALLTGDAIDAARAIQLALVNQVVPADQMLESAMAFAERIARNSTQSVRASKKLADLSLGYPNDRAHELWQLNDDMFADLAASADAVEGASAFAAKRETQWRDR